MKPETAVTVEEVSLETGALSMVVWVSTIGMVIGPNLGAPGQVLGNLTGLTTYAAAFLIALVFSTFAGFVIFVFLRPDPLLVSNELGQATNPTGPKRRRGALKSIGAEMKTNRAARNAVIAIIVAQVVMVSIMTMTPVHVMHEGGSVGQVGIIISLHIMGMFAFAPLVYVLIDTKANK